MYCGMQLTLEGVTKTFGAFNLEPLSLSIPQGEFFSLLGPSGCGKTTVLRLIGGFEYVTGGTIRLGDTDITRLPPHQRNIHTVFQRYALFPHLNVYENVAFALRLKKVVGPEVEKRTLEALRLVEIEQLRDRKIHQISGGQAQRVALARALVDHPPVLLLDEPLSALDPALRVRMREELRALCRKVGSTFIFVTHDQDEALQLSDRIAVMKDGKCLQVGTPKAIYEDPVNTFVASFIGPVNEIPGEIQEAPNGDVQSWSFSSTVGQFRLKRNGVVYPRNVSLILRPEKMRLLRSKAGNQDNLVEGEIQELSYLGSRTEYTVKSHSLVFKVFEAELERQKKRSLNPGDRIFLTWRPEDAIILPPSGTVQ
jgi:spermidine/putrescine transport system ATP-binding protein